jgi:hypothetical protein
VKSAGGPESCRADAVPRHSVCGAASRSGCEKLNSAISGNSGHNAGP